MKKIEKARKKNKSEKEIEKISKEIEDKLTPKRDTMVRQEEEAQRELLVKIISEAKKVAKEYGIDVILDKRVTYVGGFDLTDYVIQKLNK